MSNVIYSWRTRKTESGKFQGVVVKMLSSNTPNKEGSYVTFQDKYVIERPTRARAAAIAKKLAGACRRGRAKLEAGQITS